MKQKAAPKKKSSSSQAKPQKRARFDDYLKWGFPIGLDDSGKPFPNKK